MKVVNTFWVVLSLLVLWGGTMFWVILGCSVWNLWFIQKPNASVYSPIETFQTGCECLRWRGAWVSLMMGICLWWSDTVTGVVLETSSFLKLGLFISLGQHQTCTCFVWIKRYTLRNQQYFWEIVKCWCILTKEC